MSAPLGRNGKRGPTEPVTRVQGRPPARARPPFYTATGLVRLYRNRIAEETILSWVSPRWESSWNPVPVAGRLADGTPVHHLADVEYRERHRNVTDDRPAAIGSNRLGVRSKPGRPPLPEHKKKPDKGKTGNPVGRPRIHPLPDPDAPKRPRGRPRKEPADAAVS